ncbi:transposase family protein [Duganella aquatilis]|uniref:transposase family protein n=1 Tax=Duganella aquatilis TaxID=2666082 RepID=UPI001E43F025|nr:transposase family protein [Duganella aquatilis]
MSSPINKTRHQLLLGDDAFVAAHRSAQSLDLLDEVPREHRRALALSLPEYQARFVDRDEAIAQAYFSTAYTMTQIAAHFRISYRTVSRIVRKMERLPPCSCAIGRTDPG